DYTHNVMSGLEKMLEHHDAVDANMVVVGGVTGDVNSGLVFMTLKPLERRKEEGKKKLDSFKSELAKQNLPREEYEKKIAEFKFRNPITQQESIALFRKELEETPFPGSSIIPIDPSLSGLPTGPRKFGVKQI